MLRVTRFTSGLFGLFTALACAPAVGASETEDKHETHQEVFVEGQALELPTVGSTAAKLPVRLRDTPASVGIVGRALAEEQGARTLSDALSNVSGVNVQPGQGVHDFFVIRGFDSLTGGLTLTDGAPEPEVTFYHLYNVERSELLKGPAGFLYGGGALAGAANLVRKQPLFENFARVGLSAGRFSTYSAEFDANLGSTGKDKGLRLNALWDDTAGWRDGKDGRALAVNPAFSWAPSPETSISFNAEYVQNRYVPDAGLPLVGGNLPDVPRERHYESPFDLSDQDVVRLRVDASHSFGERLTLRNKLYFTRLDWDSRGTLLSGVFPSATGSLDVVRTLLDLDDSQTLVGNQLEATLSLASRHQLLLGFELARASDRFSLDIGLLPSIDLFSPVETATQPVFFVPSLGQSVDARSITAAPYALDRIRVSDELAIWLGARLDHIDFEHKDGTVDRSDTDLSPLVGAVVSPRPDVDIYINAGRGFSPPSTRSRDGSEPERSRQVELGVRHRFLDGQTLAEPQLTLAASIYELERSDIAIPDPNGITAQNGDQRSRGLELELSLRARGGFQGLANYAYNDSVLTSFSQLVQTGLGPTDFAVVDRSGNRAPFAPRHLGRLWLRRSFANGLGLSGGARFVSEQFIAEDEGFATDGHVTLDAAVSYELDSCLVSLNLDNLTDREYETRGFGASSVIPARPFSVAARLRYQF